MKRFFVKEPLAEGVVRVLGGPDARHIRTVLRLRPGHRICLFDGNGVEWESRIVTVEEGVTIVPERAMRVERESPLYLAVAQAFLKEKKMDALVRQYTELGVRRWIPYFAERSVARPSERRLEARHDRWSRITRESLKQCGRHRPVEIGRAKPFAAVAQAAGEYDLNIVFWEGETAPLAGIVDPTGLDRVRRIQVLIGPEGGLTDGEVESARKAGFVSASLGPRILRAETASVAAVSLIQYQFGDMS